MNNDKKDRKGVLDSIREKASHSRSNVNPHPKGTPEAKAWDSGRKNGKGPMNG